MGTMAPARGTREAITSYLKWLLHLYFITNSPLQGPWEMTGIFNHHNLMGLEASSCMFVKEYSEPMFSPEKKMDSS